MIKYYYANLKKDFKGKKEGSKFGPMFLERYIDLVKKGIVEDDYKLVKEEKKEQPKQKKKEDIKSIDN